MSDPFQLIWLPLQTIFTGRSILKWLTQQRQKLRNDSLAALDCRHARCLMFTLLTGNMDKELLVAYRDINNHDPKVPLAMFRRKHPASKLSEAVSVIRNMSAGNRSMLMRSKRWSDDVFLNGCWTHFHLSASTAACKHSCDHLCPNKRQSSVAFCLTQATQQ